MVSLKMNNCLRKVFTLLLRQSVWEDFKFPGGGLSDRILTDCHNTLEKRTGNLSPERLVDFCVCQVYFVSGCGKEYRQRWKVSHSFGQKAIQRFDKNTKVRYYENRWLELYGLSRSALIALITDQSIHPFDRFIYPEYEEGTKRRLLSSEAGYAVCAFSTLLWTPFSPCCRACHSKELCRQRTREVFPELYRVRIDSWIKKGYEL